MTSSPPNKELSAHGFALEDVAVSFRGTAALGGVTLSVEPGERLAIVGASGAGKTTLFRTLTRGVAARTGIKPPSHLVFDVMNRRGGVYPLPSYCVRVFKRWVGELTANG